MCMATFRDNTETQRERESERERGSDMDTFNVNLKLSQTSLRWAGKMEETLLHAHQWYRVGMC